MKKVAILCLLSYLLPLASAQIDKYIYSSQEQVFEILNSICTNPEFTKDTESSINQSCSTYPDYGLMLFGHVAFDFIKGDFTGGTLEEGLLITNRMEAEWFPRYVLVQKRPTGWLPLATNEKTVYTNYVGHKDYIHGMPFRMFKGAETDTIVTLPGNLYVNEMSGTLRIHTANFQNDIHQFETIFNMGNVIPYWWHDCIFYNAYNSYVVSKFGDIPNGSPLAQIEAVHQEDKDNNGFEDLILDIDIRYWQKPKEDNSDCHSVYLNLPVNNHEVIFTFDGYTFTPYKNVEWLQHIYDDLK